ncbi:MAG TPA: formylmethanofuran dehydrogenase subunit C [Gemmatimonadaceae bacterium]|nr:formylmethanofuran dehydrogenase subunit C [Gemmatimonadaceae bacterium]
MSARPSEIVLTLRAELDGEVELDAIAPDRLAMLDEREIAALPAWCRGERVSLGDLFEVRGARSDHVRLEGDLSHARLVGAGMASGCLVVGGNVGDGAGTAMSGGTLIVHGDAGRDLGGARAGASRGMTGGEIIVFGSAGARAGVRARRALIAIGGDAGEGAGAAMIAGTVIVFGRAGAGSARGSKRGTLVAMGGADIPEGFRYACTYRPSFLRFMLTHLAHRHHLAVDDRWAGGAYRRYSGDMAELGRGEILLWTAP